MKPKLKTLTPEIVESKISKLENKISLLRKEISKIKSRCSHDGHKKYSPDASGNNDSYYYCDVCRYIF